MNTPETATRMLPPEILSIIFQHVPRPPLNPHFHITTLGAVCFHWRRVLWTTPGLWTNISLNLLSPNIFFQANILKLYLDNSGTLPLEICLHFSPGIFYNDIDDVLNHLLVDILIPRHLIRVRDLSITSLPCLGTRGLLLMCMFSQLRKFYLTLSPGVNIANDIIQLPDIKTLSDVSLLSISGPVLLPWNSITSLYLSKAPIDTCVQSLLQCPNLVKYRMADSCDPVTVNDFWVPPSTGLVTLANLEEFTWTHSNSPWEELMLHRLHAPVLKSFTWDETGDFQMHHNDALKVFCQRLPKGLVNLVVEGIRYDSTFFTFLPGDLEVEDIYLSSSCFGSLYDAAINRLRVLYSETEGIGRTKIVPFSKLKHLRISNKVNNKWNMLGPADTCSLLSVLYQRVGPGKELTLYFDSELETRCSTCDLMQEVTMSLKNHYLRVLEDGRDPTWFRELIIPQIGDVYGYEDFLSMASCWAQSDFL